MRTDRLTHSQNWPAMGTHQHLHEPPTYMFKGIRSYVNAYMQSKSLVFNFFFLFNRRPQFARAKHSSRHKLIIVCLLCHWLQNLYYNLYYLFLSLYLYFDLFLKYYFSLFFDVVFVLVIDMSDIYIGVDRYLMELSAYNQDATDSLQTRVNTFSTLLDGVEKKYAQPAAQTAVLPGGPRDIVTRGYLFILIFCVFSLTILT